MVIIDPSLSACELILWSRWLLHDSLGVASFLPSHRHPGSRVTDARSTRDSHPSGPHAIYLHTLSALWSSIVLIRPWVKRTKPMVLSAPMKFVWYLFMYFSATQLGSILGL